YRSGVFTHRDLPSFPTRRSSDLRSVAAAEQPQQEQEQVDEVEVQRQRARDRQVPGAAVDQIDLLDLLGVIGGQAGEDQHADHVVDRKSTRLNSSHVKISYAVFCL